MNIPQLFATTAEDESSRIAKVRDFLEDLVTMGGNSVAPGVKVSVERHCALTLHAPSSGVSPITIEMDPSPEIKLGNLITVGLKAVVFRRTPSGRSTVTFELRNFPDFTIDLPG